uniref:Beta-1,4-mannosyltransferase egh n=1 Tax=Aceria tosichella TaxID=561515 RepID=A0A6G1SL83_9ACAR
MPRYFKHICHVVIFWAFMIALSYESLGEFIDSNHEHKVTPAGLVMLALQIITLLAVPQMICNILGLTFFDTFPGDIEINKKLLLATNDSIENVKANGENGLLHSSQTNGNNQLDQKDIPNNLKPPQSSPPPSLTHSSLTIPTLPPKSIFNNLPHLCFRVVTRGCFPELVNNNVRTNLLTCIESGLTNFSIEVVTDIDINLTIPDPRITQIVVPGDYVSSTKARFKARALQYALEPGTSARQDDDYIIHLDEETIITRNVVYGIINFALEGKHAFGQGLITYANLEIVNIFTTLADSFRVSRDLGNIRFTLAALHRPIFGIKGSFVVTKCSAEKDVSFDHGEDGSIAEDCYFSMIAYKKGYTFDFIMGEMYEKSPFTIMDLIKQRKRWLQGIWLVVGSPKIPWNTKFFLSTSLYAWITLPLASLSFTGMLSDIPYSYYLKPINALTFSSTVYMYFFGLVKSFDLKKRSVGILIVYSFIQLLIIGVYFFIENIVVFWGVFTNKHNFYIVEKEKKASKTPPSQMDTPIIARF